SVTARSPPARSPGSRARAPCMSGSAAARWTRYGSTSTSRRVFRGVPARPVLHRTGLGPECRNPFRSIIVRAVEVVCAIEEALRLIGEYQPPAAPSVAITPREGAGYGVSEAPRGVLYHRYELDGDGIIRSARIVPPTSQNQRAIEDDLRRFVQARLDFDDARLSSECEQAIRNYDPCISCS